MIPGGDTVWPALNETLGLSPAQEELAESYDSIVAEFGPWDPDASEVQYQDSADRLENAPDANEACINCEGWCGFKVGVIQGPSLNFGTCKWVAGSIDPMGICRLNLTPEVQDDSDDEDTGDDSEYSAVVQLVESGPTSTEVHVPSILGSMSQAYTMPYTESAAVATIVKSAPLRYTLAPWYIPDVLDAHGEWTDADELRQALWNYSENASRVIKLQHNTDIDAGKWVDLMQWPYEQKCQMINPQTGKSSYVTFPPGTVYLGVIWEPWAWNLVLEGKILGYSIGGVSHCIEVEVEMDGDKVTEAA